MEQTDAKDMTLDLAGEQFHDVATAKDIAAAVARRPRGPDWYLTLEGLDDVVDATVDPSGGLRLSIDTGGTYLKAEVPDDDALVTSVFASVLARDGRWRGLCAWSEPPKAAESPASLSSIPIEAKVGLVFIACLVAVFSFPYSWLPSSLPEGLRHPGPWMVLLFALGLPGIIVFAIIVKMREVRRAATWKQGRAEIVKSELVAQTVQNSGAASKRVNKPSITYEFTVGPQRYRGTRIGIGEIAGNDPRIPEIMKRYRHGASVPVYYDPENPKNCVLERDVPAGFGAIWVFIGALTVVFLGIALFFMFPDQALAFLAPYFPKGAHPHFVIFFAFAGLLAVAVVFGGRMQANQAARWPKAPGRIVASRAEGRSSSSGRNPTRVYEPVVEYAYSVAGQEYRGSRVSFGASVAAGKSWAQKRASAYPVGGAVTVHYDPANPAESVLEPRVAFAWGGLSIALVCFALAAYFAGH